MNDNIAERIRKLRDDAWEIARDILDHDIPTYRVLSSVVEQLAKITQPNEALESTVLNQPAFVERDTASEEGVLPSIVPIFARYGADTRYAKLDTSRISRSGRGKCVFFEGQWMTVSGAAVTFTPNAVNGWRFWLYKRNNGIEAPIDEIRKLQLGSNH